MTDLPFLALFVIGALLSIGEPGQGFVLAMHQVAPLLVLVSSAIGIYVLAGGRLVSQMGG